MLNNKFYIIFLWIAAFTFPFTGNFAQKENNQAITDAVNGLQLRSIGPALMGGRISDIAVSPTNQSTWSVAAGSGNLWKTSNSGITWQPIFENQSSYSI